MHNRGLVTFTLLYKDCIENAHTLNPNQPRAILEAELPGGGGGGLLQPPLQISAADRSIAAKICIKVECHVNYKTVLLDYSLLLSFILYELIMLIYAQNLIFTINH